MKKLLLVFVFCLGAIASVWANPAGIKDSIGVTKIDEKVYIRHLVTPGETVYGISTKYRVSITDLMEINPDLENGLKVGQVINVLYDPKLKQTLANEDDKVYHTVQPGETMFALARKYNISVTDLMKYNNMELKAGQKIVVGVKDGTEKTEPVVQAKAETPKAENKPKIEEKPKAAEPVKAVVAEQPKAVEKPAVKDEPVKDEKVVTETPAVVTAKVDAPKPEQPLVVKNENLKKEVQVVTKSEVLPNNGIDYNNAVPKLLVIPFDPYLYFSDADDEIAAVSKLQRPKVRQAFRKRLNALLEPEGYETIHLLGGRVRDSLTDLNKVYSSVTYSYQDALYNPQSAYFKAQVENGNIKIAGRKEEKKPKKVVEQGINTSKATMAKDEGKYFGVKVVDPEFFSYFNHKYQTDYYIFVNQFEVKTNYDHCLDRASLNYERSFITHFSIFDKNGKQVSGNRIKIDYNSNSNNIQRILTDNMQLVADRIISELPNKK